uniref:CHCH domain-containing protein n=1 Tax=Leersia perrieri TaxID=77586 RepID=A0A0D9WWD6_9ORYZ
MNVNKCKSVAEQYRKCSNPPKAPRLCPAHELAFERCLQKNKSHIKECQFWMDMMRKCHRRNKQ